MSGEDAFRGGIGSICATEARIYHLTPGAQRAGQSTSRRHPAQEDPALLHTRGHPQRADIDGLRAVAVLSVIFFHYLPDTLPGGFVGVDVFFVISGYLITDHIATELRMGRFSLLAFYEKRIRRIVPALTLMNGLTLLASVVIQFPPDLHFHSDVAVHVTALMGNFTFFHTAGRYGGEIASNAPLLHTWSLAIEEQFYAVFPLLMLAIGRFGRGRYSAVLRIIAIISLAVCVIGVRVAPLATFYLPYARAWELLAGALLAVGSYLPPADRRMQAGLMLVGLALIGIAAALFSTSMPYPSELTLLPCVGAIAVIYARSDESVPLGWLLDNAIMRRIGLWSYSLYLVHWPLLVLSRYYALEPLSLTARVALLVATFVIGALSWRYVEQPFRGPNALLSRRPVLFGVAAGVTVALLCSWLAVFHSTSPQHYDMAQRRLFTIETPTQERCRNTSPVEHTKPPCVLGNPDAPVDTLLWGDSHALAMLPAIDSAFAKHHQAVMFSQHGGCPALPGVYIRAAFPAQSALLHSWADPLQSGDRAMTCKSNTDAVLGWVLAKHIHTVILVGHWMAYIGNELPQRLTTLQDPDNFSQSDNPVIFARSFDQLLDVLEGARVKVYVLDDSPQYPVAAPYALAAARRLGRNFNLGLSRAQYDAQQRPATSIFAQLQQRHRFQILRPEDFLCAGDHCAAQQGDIPLYVDKEHLSAAGALIAEPALAPIWQEQQ